MYKTAALVKFLNLKMVLTAQMLGHPCHMKILLIYIISVYGACFSERCPETKKRFFGLATVACDVFKSCLPFNMGENAFESQDNQIALPPQKITVVSEGGSIPATFENQGTRNTVDIDIEGNKERTRETFNRKRCDCNINWRKVLKCILFPITFPLALIFLCFCVVLGIVIYILAVIIDLIVCFVVLIFEIIVSACFCACQLF